MLEGMAATVTSNSTHVKGMSIAVVTKVFCQINIDGATALEVDTVQTQHRVEAPHEFLVVFVPLGKVEGTVHFFPHIYMHPEVLAGTTTQEAMYVILQGPFGEVMAITRFPTLGAACGV